MHICARALAKQYPRIRVVPFSPFVPSASLFTLVPTGFARCHGEGLRPRHARTAIARYYRQYPFAAPLSSPKSLKSSSPSHRRSAGSTSTSTVSSLPTSHPSKLSYHLHSSSLDVGAPGVAPLWRSARFFFSNQLTDRPVSGRPPIIRYTNG